MSFGTEQKQLVQIRRDLSTGRSWEQKINLRFVPAECIIRQILYQTSVDESDYCYSIMTNMSVDPFMGAFSQNVAVTPRTRVQLQRDITQSTVKFQIDEEEGSLTTHAEGLLVLVLEFVSKPVTKVLENYSSKKRNS